MTLINIGDFRTADIRPPGPSFRQGYVTRNGDDEVRYLQVPDLQFNRPWLATPGGSAYIWPAGIQGFSMNGSAQVGILHYLGETGTDVDVTYPDEFHISLTGSFPGKTSAQNLHALRSVILQPSREEGKILGLPGIFPQLIYVAVLNHQFGHDENDPTHSITYSIEFIKTLSKQVSTITQFPQGSPNDVTVPRGKGHKQVSVKPGLQNIRSIAKRVYGSASSDAINKLLLKNKDVLDKAGISPHKVTTSTLPTGLSLNF